MKVHTITAAIRYSQHSGKGAWKSLEISQAAQPKESSRSLGLWLYS